MWALITTITKQKKPKILIKLYVAREILVEMIEWTNEWGECEKDRERERDTHTQCDDSGLRAKGRVPSRKNK